MESEFVRTRLLLSEEKLHILKQTTVMTLGIGGVGSHCIEALARCGVGKLILVDHDTVSLSNINRQSIAFHSTVGRRKTEVMKERIADICPDIEVVTREMFVMTDNVDELFADRPDYIIDAIDTVTAKIAIAQKAIAYGIPMISSMGTGNKLHAELFEIADISKTSVCPLCKVMRRELKARGISHLKVLYSREKPIVPDAAAHDDPEKKRPVPGSISFVPPVAGLLIAGEAVRDIVSQET